jgi:hypothetical protein
MGLAITTNAFANTNKVLTDALLNCMDIANDIDRLACFDLLTSKQISISDNVIIVKETPVKKDVIPETEAKKVDDFSKEVLKKNDDNHADDSIAATISKLKKLIRGQWVIYFENGQKWQQTDTIELKLAVGDLVRLEKGSFSSVYLYKEGVNRNIRVKRLK